MPVRQTGNPKRRLYEGSRQAFGELAQRACYTGNPSHKRNPGNFGLEPPSQPRPGKTLCDGAGVFSREDAQRLLEKGIRRGSVSAQWRNGWPQNVWTITEGGDVLEAALENQEAGTYHGYPLQGSDPMRECILDFWR
jgi:hypothetical protein